MQDCSIIMKFAVMFYVVLINLNLSANQVQRLLIFLLIYTSVNLLQLMVRNRTIKLWFYVASMAIIIYSKIYVSEIFFLFFPILLSELFGSFSYSEIYWYIVTAASVIFAWESIRNEYIFISVICIACSKVMFKYYKKIYQLSEENFSLREKNISLTNKINSSNEYESQIKYVSQLEERNKIAQEIHDNIGHTLSASLMQLEAAKLVMKNDPEKSNGLIQSTIGVLREGMENIRDSLRSIKPPAEQLGINRLKLILDEFMVNNHIRTFLYYSGNLDMISYFQWKVMTENINEALTNVLKHSNASEIKVTVEVLNKFIKLEIRDNGIGSLKIKKGLGITGMEDRVQNMGGKVIIDGSKGFSIIVLLPIV